jgi:hypothetical protein
MSTQVSGSAFHSVLRSEWFKLWSVRSTYVALLIGGGFALVVGLVETSSIANHWASMSAEDRAGFDAVGATFDGLQVAVLAFGVLGVLTMSSEYATGAIRTSLAAVPNRGVFFGAKALVLGTTTLLLGEALAFVTFFLGQSMLSRSGLDVGITDPKVLRAVISSGLFLCVVALVGLGLGAIVRHSAGALAVLFGVLFVSYAFARALESWSYLPDQLLLANAADVIGQVHVVVTEHDRIPSLRFAYFDLVLYLTAALGLGAWRTRQDP